MKGLMLRNYSDLIDFSLLLKAQNQGCIMQVPLESGSWMFCPASSSAEMVTKEIHCRQ
jgi:hypothetical protein